MVDLCTVLPSCKNALLVYVVSTLNYQQEELFAKCMRRCNRKPLPVW